VINAEGEQCHKTKVTGVSSAIAAIPAGGKPQKVPIMTKNRLLCFSKLTLAGEAAWANLAQDSPLLPILVLRWATFQGYGCLMYGIFEQL
jgi:hypothetical protein